MEEDFARLRLKLDPLLGADTGSKRMFDFAHLGHQVGSFNQCRRRITPGYHNVQCRLRSADGPEFFRKFGWTPVAVRSLFHVAGGLKRLPFPMSFFYRLLKSEDFQSKRPWGGACLLERS